MVWGGNGGVYVYGSAAAAAAAYLLMLFVFLDFRCQRLHGLQKGLSCPWCRGVVCAEQGGEQGGEEGEGFWVCGCNSVGSGGGEREEQAEVGELAFEGCVEEGWRCGVGWQPGGVEVPGLVGAAAGSVGGGAEGWCVCWSCAAEVGEVVGEGGSVGGAGGVVDVEELAEESCCAGGELGELLGWVLGLRDWRGLVGVRL